MGKRLAEAMIADSLTLPTEDARTLSKQAARWSEAMRRLWLPLGRMPRTCAEGAALALESGLEGDWHPAGRLGLIRAAASPYAPVRGAFVTLACLMWPGALEQGEDEWLLPLQLAWVHAGLDVNDKWNGPH